jgi:MFS family permease
MAGNLKVIRITTILLPIVPVLWLGSSNVIYLMAANVVSGFAWSGYSLSATNFIYDASEPAIRHKQLAEFSALDGIAGSIGFLLGGVLASRLPAIFNYQLQSIFTLSGVMRAVVVIVLLRQIAEVRPVTSISAWNLMKVKLEDVTFKKRGRKVKETVRLPVDED